MAQRPTLNFRCNPEMVEKIEQLLPIWAKRYPGVEITKADVIRQALGRGLDSMIDDTYLESVKS